MEIKLIGTCYSHSWDGIRAHRAIIGTDTGYRLTRRKLPTAEAALRYGKRLFYRLERTGQWEIVERGMPASPDEAMCIEMSDGFPV